MGDSDMPLIEVFSVPQLLDLDRVHDDLAMLETIGTFLTSVHEGVSLVIFCVAASQLSRPRAALVEYYEFIQEIFGEETSKIRWVVTSMGSQSIDKLK
jgi:hypothetical protein